MSICDGIGVVREIYSAAGLRSSAVYISLFAIVATADLPWAIFLALTHNLHPSAAWTSQLFLAAQVLPAPLSLLAVAILYLRIYASQILCRSNS